MLRRLSVHLQVKYFESDRRGCQNWRRCHQGDQGVDSHIASVLISKITKGALEVRGRREPVLWAKAGDLRSRVSS